MLLYAYVLTFLVLFILTLRTKHEVGKFTGSLLWTTTSKCKRYKQFTTSGKPFHSQE